jgi:hypothetical protein
VLSNTSTGPRWTAPPAPQSEAHVARLDGRRRNALFEAVTTTHSTALARLCTPFELQCLSPFPAPCPLIAGACGSRAGATYLVLFLRLPSLLHMEPSNQHLPLQRTTPCPVASAALMTGARSSGELCRNEAAQRRQCRGRLEGGWSPAAAPAATSLPTELRSAAEIWPACSPVNCINCNPCWHCKLEGMSNCK